MPPRCSGARVFLVEVGFSPCGCRYTGALTSVQGQHHSSPLREAQPPTVVRGLGVDPLGGSTATANSSARSPATLAAAPPAPAVAVRPVVEGVAPLPKAECRISVVDFVRRAELKRLAAEWGERTAIEQGLPATIEDEATLQEVAMLLCVERDDLRGIRPATRTNAPTPPVRGRRPCIRERGVRPPS
jgi:hypothetical protein